MNKKILVVCPSLPFPLTGAEQSDRAYGILQLKRLGFDVSILAKTYPRHEETLKDAEHFFGVPIVTVSYKYQKCKNFFDLFKKYTRFFLNILYIDGAAFEFSDNEMKQKLSTLLTDWKPDLVWFEYTYLWPLYDLVKTHNIPIITRSANFEPQHFLEEGGSGFLSRLIYFIKMKGEIKTITNSSHIFAITPKEKEIYDKLTKTPVSVLPLRGLYQCFLQVPHSYNYKKKLNVFFMGSTYNVSHNYKDLFFILKDIIPLLRQRLEGRFVFHILGKKIPKEFEMYLGDDVLYDGYVDDLYATLQDMDIACIPSLGGCGMQQKIFESLCLGIPTVTSERGVAHYPFVQGTHLLTAKSAEEFVWSIELLYDEKERSRIGVSARFLSREIFERKAIDGIVYNVISDVMNSYEQKH